MKKIFVITAFAAVLSTPALAQSGYGQNAVGSQGGNSVISSADCRSVDNRPECQTSAAAPAMPRSGDGMGLKAGKREGTFKTWGIGTGIPSGGTWGDWGSNGGSSGTGG